MTYVSWKDGNPIFSDEPVNNPNVGNILGQFPMPSQHVEWGIIIGTIAFLILYTTGHYDFALFVLGIVLGGVFVDLYIHDYGH